MNKWDLPYYAVIFSSIKQEVEEDYYQIFKELKDKASKLDGYLGWEDGSGENGSIAISYWKDMATIQAWKRDTDHIKAKKLGVDKWYQYYRLRICKVEMDKTFVKDGI